MLSLILGRKRTGKTALCVKAAKEAAELGKEVILLVPEQFSFECQRLLLETLGPVVSNKIKIHSFTSLCSEICTCYGGIAGRNVYPGTPGGIQKSSNPRRPDHSACQRGGRLLYSGSV